MVTWVLTNGLLLVKRAVDGDPLLFFVRYVFFLEDGRDRTDRFARATVDTHVGVNQVRVPTVVNRIDRTGFYAIGCFFANARRCDDERYGCSLLSTDFNYIQSVVPFSE